MKTQEVTKTVTHYIANDGKDFGEDRAACELYEFENPYIKDMDRIPKMKDIMFFFNNIDAYWCESQEDVDLCCNYFQECKRKENLMNEKKNESMSYRDSLCSGRFLYPGYYFIIKLNSNLIDTYGMFSLSQIENFWKVFLIQIPKDPTVQKQMEELNTELKKMLDEDIKTESIIEESDESVLSSVTEIFEQIKNEKIIPKIYTSKNINEYKADKEKKESENNDVE